MNEQVYEKAVKLLERRFHTTGELYQKLKLRKFKDEEIRPVISRLEELGFLDDERFAQIYVENMKIYKDWGYYGIKAKLLQKRIDSNMAEQALREFYLLEEEEKVARRLIEKLKRQGRVEMGKVMASLERKGFRSTVIRKVCT